MQQPKDLIAYCDPAAQDRLVEAMTSLAQPPWSRSLEGEDNIGDDRYRCFERAVVGDQHMVRVAVHREEDRIEIVNIVPDGGPNLEPQTYNQILDEFRDRLLRPAADKLGILIEGSSGQTSLRDELGDTAADLLQKFSAVANKATGTAHPLDFRRWADFLIAVHRSGARLDTGLLRHALKQEQGWSDSRADQLVLEAESGLELLRHYDAQPD